MNVFHLFKSKNFVSSVKFSNQKKNFSMICAIVLKASID